ncbi:hypothetical protein A7982_12792 [Minicystis rosea]|nr:hypothetical protein A7982_12792 [Minicystis rosea]
MRDGDTESRRREVLGEVSNARNGDLIPKVARSIRPVTTRTGSSA